MKKKAMVTRESPNGGHPEPFMEEVIAAADRHGLDGVVVIVARNNRFAIFEGGRGAAYSRFMIEVADAVLEFLVTKYLLRRYDA